MALADLSLRSLFAQKSGRSYAITTTFDGRDLVNGGMHMAVDVGNFGMDDPILSPITGRARGLYHHDTAIGIEYDLGDGWTLELWHLNATLAPGLVMTPGRSDVGDWVNVSRGQVCGRTGNSGALVNGKPMPAHTHTELERAGVRYDAAPYLLGAPFDPTKEDDVSALERKTQFLAEPYIAELLPGTAVRSDAVTAGDPIARSPTPAKGQTVEPWRLTVVGIALGEVVNGSDRWEVYGAHNRGLATFHSSTVARRIALAGDTSAIDNKVAAARTAVDGAANAILAAQRSLA